MRSTHITISSSPRLRYRLMDSTDAPLWHELDQDPEVMHFLNEGRPTSWEEIKQFMVPRVADFTDLATGCGLWEVVDKASGEYLGWILARHYRHGFPEAEKDNIELGWRLKRQYWGQGLATEAAKAVMQGLNDKRDIRVFSAIADAGNLASIGVMKKLGMTYIDSRMHVVPDRPDHPVVYYEMAAQLVAGPQGY